MTHQRTAVVGVFSSEQEAERAMDDLRRAGFRDDQIGIARRRAEGETGETAAQDQGTHAGTGAVAGVVAGAGLGALAGLGILAGVIPAIGPAIAGGTLAVLLSNAAGGAVVAGLVGALVGAGVPEEEAQYYNREFEAGRTIVTVKAEGRADEATMILRRHGAYDMQTAGTAEMPREARAAEPTAAAGTATARHAEGGQRIQVKEEELHAHKQPVAAGEVRVHKEVRTEHQTVDVPVRKEEVVIERHGVTGQPAATTDFRPGEEIRVPVMEEQVTVEKTPVVKEEVTVGKRVVQDTERVAGDVRKEEVRVERQGDVDVRDSGPGTARP
jgi:uncharacterized protein (TIGR02271 family)